MILNELTTEQVKTKGNYNHFKKKVHLLLDPTDGGTKIDRVINRLIISLILLNLLAVCLETVDSLYKNYRIWFYNIELFSILFFTIEYLLRVWSCTAVAEYRHPVLGRI